VGAYSNDGKSWNIFDVFQSGSAVSVWPMRNPLAKERDLVFAGGCTNSGSGAGSFSTAKLETAVGQDVVSATGGTSEIHNSANFGSIGYDRDKRILYAVENSGDPNNQVAILHRFLLGDTVPTDPATPSTTGVFWAGPHYPGLEPVIDCTCVPFNFAVVGHNPGNSSMVCTGNDGKEHTLEIMAKEHGLLHLFYDGADITPSDARHISSAAMGVNDDGEMIIITVGFSLKGTTDDHGIARWSIEGNGWTEISGIWTGTPSLQAPGMAVAVPNSAIS
jgi:hypothetical protein